MLLEVVFFLLVTYYAGQDEGKLKWIVITEAKWLTYDEDIMMQPCL